MCISIIPWDYTVGTIAVDEFLCNQCSLDLTCDKKWLSSDWFIVTMLIMIFNSIVLSKQMDVELIIHVVDWIFICKTHNRVRLSHWIFEWVNSIVTWIVIYSYWCCDCRWSNWKWAYLRIFVNWILTILQKYSNYYNKHCLSLFAQNTNSKLSCCLQKFDHQIEQTNIWHNDC